MTGISALIKRILESSSPSATVWEQVRKHLSMNQEKWPWSWTSQSPELWEMWFLKIFIYFATPGLSCRMQDLLIFTITCRFFSCSMWHLVCWSGIELWSPVLGMQCLSHWTTREVPSVCFLNNPSLWYFCSSSPNRLTQLLLFSHPVVSNSFWPRGLQHARPPCPSPPPEVCWSSWPLHRWCLPDISSSDTLFSFCPQSFPSIRDFSNESAVCIRWPNYWSSASA